MYAEVTLPVVSTRAKRAILSHTTDFFTSSGFDKPPSTISNSASDRQTRIYQHSWIPQSTIHIAFQVGHIVDLQLEMVFLEKNQAFTKANVGRRYPP